jgi:hypothetical protein
MVGYGAPEIPWEMASVGGYSPNPPYENQEHLYRHSIIPPVTRMFSSDKGSSTFQPKAMS